MLPTKVRKRRVASYIGAGVVVKDPPADPDPEARSTPADTPTTDSE
jgi:hypothetical protein